MRFVRITSIAALLAAIVVSGAIAMAITDETLTPPSGTQGTPYSHQFQLRGGCPPYSFSHAGGDLPPGLDLSDEGRIGGTPATAGSWSFWVNVKDTGVMAGGVPCNSPMTSRWVTIRINAKLLINSSPPMQAITGTPFSVQLTANLPVTQWSLNPGSPPLPPGLTISPTGVISGTPTTAGEYGFRVLAKDDANGRSDSLSFTIKVIEQLKISPVKFADGEVGMPYAAAAPGGTGGVAPYKWSLAGGALPGGLSAPDPASGVIGGTPSQAGSFSITLKLEDASGQSATINATITIAAKPVIVTKRLPSAKIGRAYRATLVSRGGAGVIAWRLTGGKLPPGIRFARATHELSGTPKKAGRFTFVAEITDSLGAISTKTFVIVVAKAPKTRARR
jgi:hypothetical protein